MVLLTHYNLLPSHHLFGSSNDNVPVDYYDVDTTSDTVLYTLLTGALFSKRTFNSRSQKARYLHISPSLHGMYFSRGGSDPEVFYPLSDVIVLLTHSHLLHRVLTFARQMRMFLICSLHLLKNVRLCFRLPQFLNDHVGTST